VDSVDVVDALLVGRLALASMFSMMMVRLVEEWSVRLRVRPDEKTLMRTMKTLRRVLMNGLATGKSNRERGLVKSILPIAISVLVD